MAHATDRELALTTGVNTAMKTMRDAARAFPLLYDDDQDRARRARHLVEQYGAAYQDLVGTIDEAEDWLDATQTELDLVRTTKLALSPTARVGTRLDERPRQRSCADLIVRLMQGVRRPSRRTPFLADIHESRAGGLPEPYTPATPPRKVAPLSPFADVADAGRQFGA